MQEKNHELFRNLILHAMEGMSQTEFSAKCGISKSHFNRMLSNNAGTRPSKLTLKKIADHSTADYVQLLDACGYTDEKTPLLNQPVKNALDSKIHNAIKDFAEGTEKMTATPAFYSSLQEFADTCNMIYVTENIDIHISKPEDCNDNCFRNAEHRVRACLQMENTRFIAKAFFLIYYSETLGGKVIIHGIKTDANTLRNAGLSISSEYNDADSVCQITAKPNALSAEERLLELIFHDDQLIKYDTTLIGFGFCADHIPGVEAFIRNHKDTILSLDEIDPLRFQYENGIKRGLPATDIFANFCDNRTDESGIAAAVTVIMRHETGFMYELITETTPCPNPKRYIVIDLDENNDIDQSEMDEITNKYAYELGIEEYGKHIIPYFGYIEGPMIKSTYAPETDNID